MALHKNIRIFTWFNFCTDFILYAPVAILYFSQVSGSFALGMSVFSVVMVASAVFEVPTGIFSDRIGRKNTVVLGAIAALFSVVLYAIGGSYLWLVFGAICEGLSRSFFSGNNDAFLHDTLALTHQEDAFHEHLGKLSSMFQFALAGSAVLGALIANWSFVWVMWLSVIPKIIMIILSLQLVDVPIMGVKSANIYAHLEEAVLQFRKNKKLQLLTIVSSIRFAVGESSYLFRSAFVATLWPVWAIGFANVLSNVGAAISFRLSGPIIKKYSLAKVLNAEILCNRVVNITALMFPSVWSPALMGTSSLFYGVGQVAMQTMLQKEFTTSQRATMGSLTSIFQSVLFGIVAVVLGIVGDGIGPAKTLILGHIILLLPLLFYHQIFSDSRMKTHK